MPLAGLLGFVTEFSLPPWSVRRHVRSDLSEVPPQGAYVAKRCPVVAQNDVLVPSTPVPASAFARSLFEAGDAFEARMFEALVTQAGARVVEGEDEPARIRATLAAMESGTRVILGGQLPTDLENKRAGRPDILVAAPTGGYRAVDVKSHSQLQRARTSFEARISTLDEPWLEAASTDAGRFARKLEGDLLQLAHYQRLLEAAGLAATDGRHAAILGREGLVVWYDLDLEAWSTPSSTGRRRRRSTMARYDHEFGFRLDVIATALRHRRDPTVPLLTVPVRIPECNRCHWRDVCLEALSQQDGDISLLPGIGYTEWRRHSDRGIRTRSELAALDPHDPRYADWNPKILRQQIDEARAWVGPERFYLRDGVARLMLPRADVEIDVDLESFGNRVYLWGALRNDRGDGSSQYEAFAEWEPLTPERELRVFQAFWGWLRSEAEAAAREGRSFRVFHFGDAERTHLRRLALAGGDSTVEAFLLESFTDLKKALQEQLITGTGFGLKNLASLVGVEWTVDDPGGAESMLHYERAAGPDVQEAALARGWLLGYNRTDVEAMLAVRDYLEQHSPARLPEPASREA